MMMIPSTFAKSKSNRKLFLRYIVSVLLIVIVFMPPLYLRSHYSSAKESEFEPAVALKQNLESFKTSTTNATATTVERRKEENGITATPSSPSDLVLTAYLEAPEKEGDGPTSKSILRSVSFPITNCLTLMREFPIDNFPLDDPYLPWIHDYFPSLDGGKIQFVAQNRRKCSGDVNHTEYWLPQISLFQKVPVVEEVTAMFQRRNGTTRSGEDGETKYRIASSYQEATHNSTRFQCRFHNIFENITMTTLSEFPFDYEFISWRKGKKAMFDLKGNDKDFLLSQLLFSCPVPKIFRQLLLSPVSDEKYFSEQPALYVDLIPIRTSTRDNYLLTYEQSGSKHFERSEKINLTNYFGNQYVIPPMNDAGRIENLPICRRRHQQQQQNHSDKLISTNNDSKPNHSITKKHQKPYRLVACTWTSSSYARRGDDDFISDSASRLKEWIQFHLMVGIDHLYIYDNTDTGRTGNQSDVHDAIESFDTDRITFNAWPCKICNNNRPAHKSPGERSSQYAAESSCRERYGDLTEWLTFIDTDEYMVPMKQNEAGEYSWHPVLDEMDNMNINVIKFRSSRGKPRIDLTENLKDQSVCADPENIEKKKVKLNTEPCVGGPMQNKTFLQLYNCEYIRPPKPNRFARAMKQMYRPSYVLSHFVHYSTVTKDMSLSYSDYKLRYPNKTYISNIKKHNKKWEKETHELFMDEKNQGVLVHARSVMPYETKRRSSECRLGSKFTCMMGYLCEDDVDFVDEVHQDNVFHNSDGEFCNCWKNKVVEDFLVPKLEGLLNRF